MREMRWVAQYANGEVVKEFFQEGNVWKETLWRDIKKRQVVSFGLEGSGLRLGFLAADGVMSLNDVPLVLRLVDAEGNVFLLTDRADVTYGPPIQFKEGATSISPKSMRIVGNTVLSYNIGYRVKGRSEMLGKWEYKIIATVPTGDTEPIFAHVWLTASRGFTGHLHIDYGHRRQRVATLLRPGAAHRLRIAMPLEGRR